MGTLQFVVGKASQNHEAVIVQDIKTRLQTATANDRFFVVVPNHVKFETEVRILNQLQGDLPLYAQSQVQILSLSRLAWYLLKNNPQYHQERLSKVGQLMIVTKVLQDFQTNHPSALQAFQGEAQRPGFVQAVVDQLNLFQNANLLPTDLTINDAELPGMTAEKLTVLQTLYEQYLTQVEGWLTTPDTYDLLVEALQSSKFNDYFYLDRFMNQFTGQEAKVVEAMIEHGQATLMSILADRIYPDDQLPAPFNLYYQSVQQYQRLVRFAKQQAGIELLAPVMPQQVPMRVSESLQAVETWMQANAKFQTLAPLSTPPAGVEFMVAANRLNEVDQIAREIRQLVAQRKCRYRQFLLLPRHLKDYETVLSPVFSRYDLPLFIDHQRSMADAPLVTMLDALFKVLQNHYQLPDVMQLLKTGLLRPLDDDGTFLAAVYQTENWFLKYGMTNRAWLKSTWTSLGDEDDELMAQLNQVRKFIAQEIMPALAKWQTATTGKELATRVYEFLIAFQVDQRMLTWANEASERGDLTVAQQHHQVWQTLTQLLDEYVNIFGETSIEAATVEQFGQILMTGLTNAEYSQIPSTMDQIMASEIGMIQSNHRRVVIVFGANDEVMPEVKASQGLLTDHDLAWLRPNLRAEQFLPLPDQERINNEPFINHLAMLSATEKLILSVATMGGDESPLQISPYVIGLAQYTNQWDDRYQRPQSKQTSSPLATDEFKQVSRLTGSPLTTLGQLVTVLRQVNGRIEQLSPSWQWLANWLTNYQPGQMEQLTHALHYQNQTTPLDPELARRLYLHVDEITNQPTFIGSVTQLQTYYQNPYEYFLKYGLRLKKREELTVSADRSGTFYHTAMEQLVRLVRKQPDGWHRLGMDEQFQTQMTQAALKKAYAEQPYLRELANNDYQVSYQLRTMEKIVQVMVTTLGQQFQFNQARPVMTEQSFGHQEYGLPALTQTLADGTLIQLRGRIDRIDQLPDQQQAYIVDYKSSDRKFDLVKAYEGLDLQLLAYLDAAQAALPDQQFMGTLYQYLAAPKQTSSGQAKLVDEQAFQLASHRMRGVLLNQAPALTALDHGLLADKPNGQVVTLTKATKRHGNLKVSDDGTIGALQGTMLLQPAQLKWLVARNRERIQTAVTQILAGDIRLAPVRYQTQTGFDFSDYLDIYQFDQLLDRYQEVTTTEDQIIDQMEQELGKDTMHE
ncbi:MAG: PD-(D/E)XK nuclease family protein [Limosilactobacillus sp.]|nr:PD-(D/E)XK nuclease family protein [Limosilactobacillus sp.]